MSLQIAAKHLATKGRGPDTTLVHMTNKEVQGLQALAEKNGGSLSINPDTGLPEAGFLESILPLVAGVGLAAAGMPAGYAALTVGGVTALSTGNLSKGLYAGLGAYGGASLGQQLAVQGMSAEAAANASFGDKLTNMGQNASFENIGNFISANPKTAMAGIAGPLLSSMEDEQENDKPAEPVKDTDPGARARSGIKFNPGYMTPTPLPNPYGIEQTYATPYYAAEGGVTHMAEGGMAYGGSTSGPIDTKAQFADYLNKVMNPTNRTNAVSGSTNPYEWWKSPSTPEAAPAAPPAETAEEYAARMSLNARGGGGGPSAEEREAQLNEVNDYLSTPENPITMNQYFAMSSDDRKALDAAAAERNPIRAGIGDFVKTLGVPIAFRAIQSMYDNFTGPSTEDPKSVGMVFPTENDRIKAEETAKYRQSLLGDTSGYTDTGTSEIDRVTTEDARNAAVQRAADEAANVARMQADTYPFGNFADAPLSSRRDVSGYPLRESELKSFERGLALDSVAQTNAALTGSPVAPMPYSAGDEADRTIDSRPEAGGPINYQAKSVAGPYASGRNSNYSEPTTGFTTPVIGSTPLSTSKIVASEKLAGDKPVAGFMFNPADARTPYGEGEGNRNKSEIAAYIEQQESIAKNYINSGAVFGFDHPKTVAFKEEYNRYNDVINDLYNRVQYTDPTTNDYKTPFVNYTPDIVGTESEISADPNTDTDEKAESLRIPNVAKFASMLGDPIVFAMNADGTVSDAGNGLGLGYTTSNIGNVNRGPGLAGISGSFGGLGSAWKNVTDQFGGPVLTSQGAAENAFNVSPEGIAAENAREIQSLQNRAESARQEAQAQQDARIAAFDAGRSGGDRNSVTPGGGSRDAAPAPAADRGYGREGQHAAAGGLSTPYGFQHMANGGLSAMANPYNLGSYSDGGRLLKGPGDGVSDSIPATIGKGRPARLADGEFVIPARIVSEIGNGSTEAGARKLYAMMDRIQASRRNTVGKGKVAVNNRADKYLPR